MSNDCGVPHGSILQPLLFLCYINNLLKHLSHTTVSMYTDDIAILSVGKDIEVIESNLQQDMTILCNWFDANKLSLNKTTSKTMLVTSSRSQLKTTNLNITANGISFEPVSSFKYLGIELDRNLNFEHHVNTICGKETKERSYSGASIHSSVQHWPNYKLVRTTL